MHRIQTSIRRIPAADLPTVTPIGEATRPMNDQELLNIGLHRISGDYFSCICQLERDPDTLVWKEKDTPHPGTVVSEGLLQERHDKLPADVRAKVMKASVIRSKTGSAKDLASSALAAAATAATKAVGLVEGVPLIDPATPELLLAEAQRMAQVPDSDLKREIVAMDDVGAGDVIEAENLIPHSWAGEPRR